MKGRKQRDIHRVRRKTDNTKYRDVLVNYDHPCISETRKEKMCKKKTKILISRIFTCQTGCGDDDTRRPFVRSSFHVFQRRFNLGNM